MLNIQLGIELKIIEIVYHACKKKTIKGFCIFLIQIEMFHIFLLFGCYFRLFFHSFFAL